MQVLTLVQPSPVPTPTPAPVARYVYYTAREVASWGTLGKRCKAERVPVLWIFRESDDDRLRAAWYASAPMSRPASSVCRNRSFAFASTVSSISPKPCRIRPLSERKRAVVVPAGSGNVSDVAGCSIPRAYGGRCRNSSREHDRVHRHVPPGHPEFDK
jgi:hypothetical protein